MDQISARSLFDPLGTLSTAPEQTPEMPTTGTGVFTQQNPATGAFVPTYGMMQLDLDPYGKRARAKAEALGQAVPADYVEELNVFGKRMTRDQLLATKGGERLLEIATRNRRGVKGFWEGLTDHSWTVLFPFVGSITDVGTTIGDMNRIKDTMKKLQNGEAVSDEDLVMARATIAQQERDSAGTTGAMIGGILSQAPAFAAEMVLTGGLFRAGAAATKTALSKGVSYAAKESVEAAALKGFGEAALQLSRSLTDDAAVAGTRKALAGAAAKLSDDAMSQTLREIAVKAVKDSGVTATIEETNLLTGMALNKVKASAVRMANPNYVRDAADFVSEYAKKALLQHGDEAVWELSKTDKSLVREMAGILTVQAPLQGAMYASVVEGIARPAASLATGNGGEFTNRTEMSLVSSALIRGDKKLMDRASRIAFAMQIGEYGSETTGRAFGLGIDAGKKLVGMGAGMGELIETAVSKAGSTAGYTRRATYMARQAIAGTVKIAGINEGDAIEAVMADPNLVRAAFRASVDREKGLAGLKFYAAAKMMDMSLTPDAVVGFLRKAQINDVVEEMMEERYNGFYQGLFNLGDAPAPQSVREKLQQIYDQTVPDWQQTKAEFFGFAAPMVARTAIFRAQAVLGESAVSEAEHLPDALAHLYTGAVGGSAIAASDETKPTETFQAAPVNPEGTMNLAREKLGRAEKGTDAVFLDQEIAEAASMLVNVGRNIRSADNGLRGSIFKRGASSTLGVLNALISGNPYMAFYDPVRAVLADNKLPATLAEAARAGISFYESMELARRTAVNAKAGTNVLEVTPEAVRNDPATNELIQKHARELIKHHMQTQGVLPVTNEDIDRVLDRMEANNVPFRVGTKTLDRAAFKDLVRDDLVKVAKGQLKIDESTHGTGSVFYVDRSMDEFISESRKGTMDAVYSILGMPNLLDIAHADKGKLHNLDLNLGTNTVDLGALDRLARDEASSEDAQSVMFSLLGRDAAGLTKAGSYDKYLARVKAFARAYRAANEFAFRASIGRYDDHDQLLETIPIQSDDAGNQYVIIGNKNVPLAQFWAEHPAGYRVVEPKIHFTLMRAVEYETATEAIQAAKGYASGDTLRNPYAVNASQVGPGKRFETFDEAHIAAAEEIRKLEELAQRYLDYGDAAEAYEQFADSLRTAPDGSRMDNDQLMAQAKDAYNRMFGTYQEVAADGSVETHVGFERAAQEALRAVGISRRASAVRPGTQVWTLALGATNTETDIYIPAKMALDTTYLLEELNEQIVKSDIAGRIINRTLVRESESSVPGVLGQVKEVRSEYSPVMKAAVSLVNTLLKEKAASLRAEASTERAKAAGSDNELAVNASVSHMDATADKMSSLAANIFNPEVPTQEAFSKIAGGLIFHAADKARFSATDAALSPGGYGLLAPIAQNFRYNLDGTVNPVAAAFTAELDRMYGGNGFSIEESSPALFRLMKAFVGGQLSNPVTDGALTDAAFKFARSAAEAVRTVAKTQNIENFTSEAYLAAAGVILPETGSPVDAEIAALEPVAVQPKVEAIPAGPATHSIFGLTDPEDARLREAAAIMKVLERSGSLDPKNPKYHGALYAQAEYAWKQMFGLGATEATVLERLKQSNFKGGLIKDSEVPADDTGDTFSPVEGAPDAQAEDTTEDSVDPTRGDGGHADQAALNKFMFSPLVKLFAGMTKQGFPGIDARHPSNVIHQLVEALQADMAAGQDKDFILNEVLKGFISSLRRNAETGELAPLDDLAMLQDGASTRFQEWAEKLTAIDAKRDYKKYAGFVAVMETLPADDKLVLLGVLQRIGHIQPIQGSVAGGKLSLGEAYRYPFPDEANKAISRVLLDRFNSGKANRELLDNLFGESAVGFGRTNLFKEIAAWKPDASAAQLREYLQTRSLELTEELSSAFERIRGDLESFFGVGMPWVDSFTRGAASRLVGKLMYVPGNNRKDLEKALLRISSNFFSTDRETGLNKPSNFYWNIHDSFKSILLENNRTHGVLTADAIESVLVSIWRGTAGDASKSANIAGGQSGILAEVQRAAAVDTPPSTATMPGTGDKVNLIIGHPSAVVRAMLDRKGGIFQRQYASMVKDATGVEPDFDALDSDLDYQINREFGRDANGESIVAMFTALKQDPGAKSKLNLNSMAVIEQICRDSFEDPRPATNKVFVPLFAGDSKRNVLVRFDRGFAKALAEEGEQLAKADGYILKSTGKTPVGYDALYYAFAKETGASEISAKRKAATNGSSQAYQIPGKTQVTVIVNGTPGAGNEVLLGQEFVSGPFVGFLKKWAAVSGTNIHKLHILATYLDGETSSIFMAKGVQVELNDSTGHGSVMVKALRSAFPEDQTNRIFLDNDAMKEGPAMLKRVLVNGKAISLSDFIRREIQFGNKPTAADTIRWKEGDTISEKTIGEILPGFMVTDLDLGGNTGAAYSFDVPRAIAQSAANISHEAKPELKSVATNVQGDVRFLTKPGESLLEKSTIMGILRLWSDVALGRATPDTLKETVLGKWMGRVSSKSLEYASELAGLVKSGLRASVSPKAFTIQAPILTPNGKYSNVTGQTEWLTGSEHEKALVAPAVLMESAEDIARYGKRRQGLARINVIDPSFRYGLWLDASKIPGGVDRSDGRAVEDFLAAKVLELYDLARDPMIHDETLTETMDKYRKLKKDFFSMFVGADGRPSPLPSLRTSIDDLVQELPDGTRRFDYAAVFAGDRAIPLADETTKLPFLGGSFVHGVRTPSGDGGAAWALSRASTPVSYDEEGFPANDAAVIVDPVTLERIGADCDGDKFMAMIHKAVGPTGIIRRGKIPFAEAEQLLAILVKSAKAAGKPLTSSQFLGIVEQNPALKTALFNVNDKGELKLKNFSVDISNAVVDQLVGISKDMSTDPLPGTSTFGNDINTYSSGATGVSPVPTGSPSYKRLQALLKRLEASAPVDSDLRGLPGLVGRTTSLRNVAIARGVGVSTLDSISTILHQLSGVRVDFASEGSRAPIFDDFKTGRNGTAKGLLVQANTFLKGDALDKLASAMTRGLADESVASGIFSVGLDPDTYRGSEAGADGFTGEQRLAMLVHKLACCNNSTYDEAKNALASKLGFTSETFELFQFSCVFSEAVTDEAFMDHLEKFAEWVNNGPGKAYTDAIARSWGEPVGYYGMHGDTVVRVNPDKTVVTSTGMVLQDVKAETVSPSASPMLRSQIDAVFDALRQLHGGTTVNIRAYQKVLGAVTQAALSALHAGKAEADVLAETTALANVLYTTSLLAAGASAVNFSRHTAFRSEAARRTEQARYLEAVQGRGAQLFEDGGIIHAPAGIVSERSVLGVEALHNLYQAIGNDSLEGLVDAARKIVVPGWKDAKGGNKYPSGLVWNAKPDDVDEYLRRRIVTFANVEGAVSTARGASGMDAARLGGLIKTLSGVVDNKTLAGDPAAAFKASVEILFNKAFALQRTSTRANPAFMQLVFDKVFGDERSYSASRDSRFGEAKMDAIKEAKSLMRLATIPGAADVGRLREHFAALLNSDASTDLYFQKPGTAADGSPLPVDRVASNSRLTVAVAPELTVSVTPSELYWLGFIYASAAYDTRRTELDTSVMHLYPPELVSVMTDIAAAYRAKLGPEGLAEKIKSEALGLAYGNLFENVSSFCSVDKVYFDIGTEPAALAALAPVREAARKAYEAVKDEPVGLTAKVVSGYLSDAAWMPSSGRIGAADSASPASAPSADQIVQILDPMLAPAGGPVSGAVIRTVLKYLAQGNFGTAGGDADKTVVPAAMYLARRYGAKSEDLRKLDHLLDQIDRGGKVLQKQNRMKFVTEPVLKQLELRQAFRSDFAEESEDANRMAAFLAYLNAFAEIPLAIPSLASPSAKLGTFQTLAQRVLAGAPAQETEAEPGFSAEPADLADQEPAPEPVAEPAKPAAPAEVFETAVNKAIQIIASEKPSEALGDLELAFTLESIAPAPAEATGPDQTTELLDRLFRAEETTSELGAKIMAEKRQDEAVRTAQAVVLDAAEAAAPVAETLPAAPVTEDEASELRRMMVNASRYADFLYTEMNRLSRPAAGETSEEASLREARRDSYLDHIRETNKSIQLWQHMLYKRQVSVVVNPDPVRPKAPMPADRAAQEPTEPILFTAETPSAAFIGTTPSGESRISAEEPYGDLDSMIREASVHVVFGDASSVEAASMRHGFIEIKEVGDPSASSRRMFAAEADLTEALGADDASPVLMHLHIGADADTAETGKALFGMLENLKRFRKANTGLLVLKASLPAGATHSKWALAAAMMSNPALTVRELAAGGNVQMADVNLDKTSSYLGAAAAPAFPAPAPLQMEVAPARAALLVQAATDIPLFVDVSVTSVISETGSAAPVSKRVQANVFNQASSSHKSDKAFGESLAAGIVRSVGGDNLPSVIGVTGTSIDSVYKKLFAGKLATAGAAKDSLLRVMQHLFDGLAKAGVEEVRVFGTSGLPVFAGVAASSVGLKVRMNYSVQESYDAAGGAKSNRVFDGTTPGETVADEREYASILSALGDRLLAGNAGISGARDISSVVLLRKAASLVFAGDSEKQAYLAARTQDLVRMLSDPSDKRIEFHAWQNPEAGRATSVQRLGLLPLDPSSAVSEGVPEGTVLNRSRAGVGQLDVVLIAGAAEEAAFDREIAPAMTTTESNDFAVVSGMTPEEAAEMMAERHPDSESKPAGFIAATQRKSKAGSLAVSAKDVPERANGCVVIDLTKMTAHAALYKDAKIDPSETVPVAYKSGFSGTVVRAGEAGGNVTHALVDAYAAMESVLAEAERAGSELTYDSGTYGRLRDILHDADQKLRFYGLEADLAEKGSAEAVFVRAVKGLVKGDLAAGERPKAVSRILADVLSSCFDPDRSVVRFLEAAREHCRGLEASTGSEAIRAAMTEALAVFDLYEQSVTGISKALQTRKTALVARLESLRSTAGGLNADQISSDLEHVRDSLETIDRLVAGIQAGDLPPQSVGDSNGNGAEWVLKAAAELPTPGTEAVVAGTCVHEGHMLVSPMSQPRILLADPAVWFNGTMLPTFRGVSPREILGDHTAEAAIVSALNTADFLEKFFGVSGPDGSILTMSVGEGSLGFAGTGGKIERKSTGEEVVRFGRNSAFRKVFVNHTFTPEELQLVHYWLKAVEGSSYSSQSTRYGSVESILVGHAINFMDIGARDLYRLQGDETEFAETFSKEAVERRLASARTPENMRDPESTRQYDVDILFRRIEQTLPKELQAGAKNAVLDALRLYIASLKVTTVNKHLEVTGKNEAHAAAIDLLYERGFCGARESNVAGVRRRYNAVLALPFRMIDKAFMEGSARAKLIEAGRPEKDLTAEYVVDKVRRSFAGLQKSVRNSAWLSGGLIDQVFTMAGTRIPAFRGSGIVSYAAKKSLAMPRPKGEERILETTESFIRSMERAKNQAGVEYRLDPSFDGRIVSMLCDLYGTPKYKDRFFELLASGHFADGRYGFQLGPEATRKEAVAAIYRKSVEIGYREAVNGTNGGVVVSGVNVDQIIRAYEARAARDLSGQAIPGGLTAHELYKIDGLLPANLTVAEKLREYAVEIANAERLRGAFCQLMMTADAYGRPLYYASPVDGIPEADVMPEIMWSQLARWWAESNELSYDSTKSGRDNARLIYDKIRQANKGASRGALINYVKDKNGNYVENGAYTELGSEEIGLASVSGLLCMKDDPMDESKPILDALSGGYAAGYMRQLLASTKTRSLAHQSAFINHVLSWSKSLSVSMSFFFPIATKYESAYAAVGPSYWSKEPGKLLRYLSAGGAAKFYDKSFANVTYGEIYKMINSNDPCFVDLQMQAAVLDMPLSTPQSNPMEQLNRSHVTNDIERVSQSLEGILGKKGANGIRHILRGLVVDPGERSFEYMINATKLATMAQLNVRLREEALAQGKAWDPILSMRRYSHYINAEVGGVDPAMYPFATPQVQWWLSVLMFSWQWTIGAWDAGGGGVLTRKLFGMTTTKESRAFMFGRWLRMYTGIMVGIPFLMQIVCKAIGVAAGIDDDDDKWFTFQNEDKEAWNSFNITPLLKAVSKLAPAVADFKKNHPLLGGLIPAYTGANSTGQRNAYMHFGKQGWEVMRWFTDPISQAISKQSIPLQKLEESVLGYNLGLGVKLPWADQSVGQRLMDFSSDGALMNVVAGSMLPFSASSIAQKPDVGILSWFGPITSGVGYTQTAKNLAGIMEDFADSRRASLMFSSRYMFNDVRARVRDVLDDAAANGIDPETALNAARGQVIKKYYKQVFDALPKTPDGEADQVAIDRAFRAMYRIKFASDGLMASIRKRYSDRGIKMQDIPNQAENLRAIRQSMLNPMGGREPRLNQTADLGGNVADLLASDNVPETVLGYRVVMPEDLSPADATFFEEYPDAAGFYDTGSGPEEGSSDDEPPGGPGGAPTDQAADQATDQAAEGQLAQTADLGGNVGSSYRRHDQAEQDTIHRGEMLRGEKPSFDAAATAARIRNIQFGGMFDSHVIPGEPKVNGRSVVHGSNYGQRLRAPDYQQTPEEAWDKGPNIIEGRKTTGFYGELPVRGGGIAGEYSMGYEVNGIIHEMPSLPPGLTPAQLETMTQSVIPNQGEVPRDIARKAMQFEARRAREGKSPFYQEGEDVRKYFRKDSVITTADYKGGKVNAADKGGHVELLRQMEYRPDEPGQAVAPPPKMPDAEPEAASAKKDPREEAVIKWALNALFSKESTRTLSPKDADYNRKTGEFEAVGPYQIHPGHVDEANKLLKKQGRTDFFTYDDRRDFWKAKQITETRLRGAWAKGVKDPLELAGRHRLPAGPSAAADSWRSPEHKKYMRELRRLLKETPVESFMDTPGKE